MKVKWSKKYDKEKKTTSLTGTITLECSQHWTDLMKKSSLFDIELASKNKIIGMFKGYLHKGIIIEE